MPWVETSSVQQRVRCTDERRGLDTWTELHARHSIGRKTIYRLFDRFDADGRRGLQHRSHAPHHCPYRIVSDIANLLGAGRRRHRDWGPGNLTDWLALRHPEIAAAWPAVKTTGNLLAREGLAEKRRRRWMRLVIRSQRVHLFCAADSASGQRRGTTDFSPGWAPSG